MAAKSDVKVIGQVAQQVIDHYRDDPFERMRMIYRRELRPMQWEWWFLMDEHNNSLVKACPRVGKSVGISLKNLDDTIINPHEEVMIFAPKYDQAVNSFSTAYDVIDSSEILQAFIRRNAGGKMEFGKGFVEFENHSTQKCFGVNSNFEGENATIFWADELDDIPSDALKRMFGRAIGKNKNGLPTRKRLSGVIWGKLNIYDFDVNDPNFTALPGMTVYQALASGFLDEDAVRDARARMTSDDWLRTMCLRYVESRNLIWSSWLKAAQYIGLYWNVVPVPPIPDHQFKKSGVVSVGLDMGHQGGTEDSSEYALTVTEQVNQYRRWVWTKTWSPDTPPDELINEVCNVWAFYRPDIGFGDALDANLIAQINDALYERNLVRYSWRRAGKNLQEGWAEWARRGLLTPVHNTGRTKHAFYTSLVNSFQNAANLGDTAPTGDIFVMPMPERGKASILESWRELQLLAAELGNLVGERVSSGYLKISRHKKHDDKNPDFDDTIRLGDDRPDSLAMSVYGLDYLKAKRRGGTDIQFDYISGI